MTSLLCLLQKHLVMDSIFFYYMPNAGNWGNAGKQEVCLCLWLISIPLFFVWFLSRVHSTLGFPYRSAVLQCVLSYGPLALHLVHLGTLFRIVSESVFCKPVCLHIPLFTGMSCSGGPFLQDVLLIVALPLVMLIQIIRKAGEEQG